jgi:hypothetical protein
LHIAILRRFLEWERREMFSGLWMEYQKERDILVDQCIDGIHMAQDRNKWWAFMNMAMNVWIP